jgi:hypothetical protein
MGASKEIAFQTTRACVPRDHAEERFLVKDVAHAGDFVKIEHLPLWNSWFGRQLMIE